ncbi:MAG: sigma-54 dependent transcriptional regulator [Acidobacteriota bacterium]|jgi:two-component system response regulator PilR (NtrC family)|nr:sigma-54 dependent transcriptional regulator [Acidobacteriota bacterium]
MGDKRILIVDDEEILRDVLSDLLESEAYQADAVSTGADALDRMRERQYAVVLLDLMLPDIDGLEVLDEMRKLEQPPTAIMLTAYASLDKAVSATKLGAFNFIAKPFKNEELLLAVKNALEHRELLEENRRLKSTLQERYGFQNIVGKGAAMRQVFDLVAQVAPRRSTVLVEGESGTGKELVARAIHAASGRASSPFVAINCGNIPPDLLESELFGHVKGAFTGATVTKKGLFEAADGGTVFLDEVGTLSMEIQARLLRVIQEREFRRLGSLENIKVDVRIIAATNTDLAGCVSRGTFRDDLYYRLNVIVVKLPPLRDRTEDIPLLAEHFIRKFSGENHRDGLTVAPEALKVLMDYHWPGNVRELENVMERAVVLAPGDVIDAALFPRNLLQPPPPAPVAPGGGAFASGPDGSPEDLLARPLKERVGEYEKAVILAALEKTGGNQKKAAGLLDVNPTTLSEKLKRLGIRDSK